MRGKPGATPETGGPATPHSRLLEPGSLYRVGMDPERARELLAQERRRLEQARSAVSEGAAESHSGLDESGDDGAETIYQEAFDDGLAAELDEQLEALARAEARLSAGTYGLSVESGDPIPDDRLEALPTAERTVAEQEAYERG